MRVFVTGATGFLGRRIVRRLVERGDQVSALARQAANTAELEKLGVCIVEGDLSDCDSFIAAARDCDVVIHAGARVVTHGDWDEFFKANVECTEKLLRAVTQAGGRFVHVSSLGIFEIDHPMVVDEDTDYDHSPMLRGYYTRSKIDADRVACAAARSGNRVVVVRPGRLNGYDHPQAEPVYLGRVNKSIGNGLMIVLGTPDYHVPTVFVENAADAVVRAACADGVDGQIFNVVDDPEMTQRSYFRLLSQARGRTLRVVFVPVALLSPVVRAVDFFHRIVRRRPWPIAYQLLRSQIDARYSTDAASRQLDWSPEVGVVDGLRACFEPPR